MKKDKILITGFPHTGTSILKSKLGECTNVYEYPYEIDFLRPIELEGKGNKEFTLIKSPTIPIEIKKYGLSFLPESIYKDYIIIFVTRNPWYFFTSVYKSGEDPLRNETYHLHPGHGFRIEEYLTSIRLFLDASSGKYPDVYAIKYEDFFVDNFYQIKKIIDNIGLKFEGDIFGQKSKDYILIHGTNYKDIDESNITPKQRYIYRTWQINQPFQNMNSDSDIPDELDDILKSSNMIKELGYTDPRITH